MYDYVLFCMIMHEYLWLWLCMTMYDYVWLCMTMYDYVWLWMTMYDNVYDPSFRCWDICKTIQPFRQCQLNRNSSHFVPYMYIIAVKAIAFKPFHTAMASARFTGLLIWGLRVICNSDIFQPNPLLYEPLCVRPSVTIICPPPSLCILFPLFTCFVCPCPLWVHFVHPPPWLCVSFVHPWLLVSLSPTPAQTQLNSIWAGVR